MREWNAQVYHRVSDPQVKWGRPVLARLPLTGTELVLDIGCGTGRLTAELLERLPHGRAVGVDLSSNMIETAGRHLRPAFPAQITFVRADAAALPFQAAADAIFSTATFHWIHDHDRTGSNDQQSCTRSDHKREAGVPRPRVRITRSSTFGSVHCSDGPPGQSTRTVTGPRHSPSPNCSVGSCAER